MTPAERISALELAEQALDTIPMPIGTLRAAIMIRRVLRSMRADDVPPPATTPRVLSADETEHLLLMGLSPDGTLAIGEGAAERVFAQAEKMVRSRLETVLHAISVLSVMSCHHGLTAAKVDARADRYQAAYDDLYRRFDEADAYVQLHCMPHALGRNIWHVILDDAISLRAEVTRLRALATTKTP